MTNEFELDSECGYAFERARRRGPVSDTVVPENHQRVAPPAPHHCNRVLHDVPLYQAATDDYAYLRIEQRWGRLRAAWTAFRRCLLRGQVASGLAIPTPVGIVLVVVFLAGMWVGGSSR